MSSSQIQCPHCGHGYALTPERQAQLQGKSIRCKQCREVFKLTEASPRRVDPPIEALVPQPPRPGPTTPAPAPWPGATVAPAGYQAPAKRARKQTVKRRIPMGAIAGAVGVVAIAAVVLTVGWYFYAARQAAMERADRIASANNLRMIAQALKTHAEDNNLQFPSDLGVLLTSDARGKWKSAPGHYHQFSVKTFLSPRSGRQVPQHILDASPQEQAEWVRSSSDYVYLGAGKQDSLRADEMLAFEKPEIGTGEGANVTYFDGRVEWISAADARRLLPP